MLQQLLPTPQLGQLQQSAPAEPAPSTASVATSKMIVETWDFTLPASLRLFRMSTSPGLAGAVRLVVPNAWVSDDYRPTVMRPERHPIGYDQDWSFLGSFAIK
jgi:hypothetical protein